MVDGPKIGFVRRDSPRGDRISELPKSDRERDSLTSYDQREGVSNFRIRKTIDSDCVERGGFPGEPTPIILLPPGAGGTPLVGSGRNGRMRVAGFTDCPPESGHRQASFSPRKMIRRRRNPTHQTGQRAGERSEAPKGRSSVAGGCQPLDSRGVAPRSVESGGDDRNSVLIMGFRRPFGAPRTEHPWASGSRGLTPPATDGRPFGAKKTNLPNGLSRLSARQPSVGYGVASTANNLARGEKGEPAFVHRHIQAEPY